MKTRSLPFLGLIAGAALIASLSGKPATACGHTIEYFNPRTLCCGCKFNMIFNKTCTFNDCNDCPTVNCSAIKGEVAAQGNLLAELSQQCSLGDDVWSRLAAPAAGVQVEVVKLKARS
jgi:hypothetical protein